MSEVSCTACQELREDAPEFVTSGVTDKVCNSLANDTGLDANNGNNDATDLHTANDCLIGRMEDELNSYDTCDWKKFMRLFIRNIYEVIKAIICAIRGIWLKIHNHESRISELEGGGAEDFCEATDNLLDLQLELTHPVTRTPIFPTTADFIMHANTITIEYCDHKAVADLVNIGVVLPEQVTNLTIGSVLFTVNKSDLVPTLMHENTWEGIMRYGYMKQMCLVEQKWLVYGILHSDENYPDKMVCSVFAIIGPSQVATGRAAAIQDSASIFIISRT